MCFELLYAVAKVDAPDLVREITVDKGVVPVSLDDVMQHITTTAKIILETAVIERVLNEGALHAAPIVILNDEEPLQELDDRSVVFTTPLESGRFLQGRVHPEVLMVSHDQRLRNSTIILKLKDFSYVAMYSLTVLPQDAVPEGKLAKAELHIKFGVDSESVKVYRRGA